MTSREKILYRLSEAKRTAEVKEYMYNMRRFVAGDETHVTTSEEGGSITIALESLARTLRINSKYPHFRIEQHEEGVSNHVLTWILNVIKQSVVSKPEIESKFLSAGVTQFRESYLLDRLESDNWWYYQFRLLYSYLIDGLAFAKTCVIGGKPRFRYRDTIDLMWDLKAEDPMSIRWIFEHLRVPEDVARSEFGDAVINKLFKDSDDSAEENKHKDRLVPIYEYWDGTTRAWLPCGDVRDPEEVLKVMETPYPGEIPYDVFCAPMLPSMLTPIPQIVTVIGAQSGLNTLQRAEVALYKGLMPTYVVDEGAFTAESYAEFLQTNDIKVLKWSEAADPQRKANAITIVRVDTISPEIQNARNALQQEIIRGIGVNPYISGASINPNFARETQEISQQSQLPTNFLREMYSEYLARPLRKMLRIGAAWDQEPFAWEQDGVTVIFNGDDGIPLAPMLMDDVPLKVRAGVYDPPEVKLMKAERLLATALPMKAEFPNLARWALEEWIIAMGGRDVDYLLQPPQIDPNMMMQMMSGMGATGEQAMLPEMAQTGGM